MDLPPDGRDGLEVIDAFVDGERVDPRALKRALSDVAGRDYFVDAWMLREGMQEERVARVADLAPPQAARRTRRPWGIAAALLVGVLGGYAAGQWGMPARVPPADQVPTNVAVAPPAAPADQAGLPAPPPTRVIQLEFQVESPASGGG